MSDEKPELTISEWDALWSWHSDQQYEHAGKENYADAEWHRSRKEVIAEFTSFSERRRAEQKDME